RGTRRRRQVRNPRVDRVQRPSGGRRRLPRGHPQGDERGRGVRPAARLRDQAPRDRGARRGADRRARAPRDDSRGPPAGGGSGRLQRRVPRGSEDRRTDVLRARRRGRRHGDGRRGRPGERGPQPDRGDARRGVHLLPRADDPAHGRDGGPVLHPPAGGGPARRPRRDRERLRAQSGLDQERVAGGKRRGRAARVRHAPRARGRVPASRVGAAQREGRRGGPKHPPGGGRGMTAQWRGIIREYRDRLPVSDATPVVTLGEGGTPLVRSESLSTETGCEVLLKFEGANPTGSFKDRGMTLAISKALEEGSKAVVCASTGNTSASASAYAAKAGLTCAVLVPKGKIALGKMAQTLIHGARVLEVDGNFDDSLALAQDLAAHYPVTLVNSVNPFRLEGQKTLAFEVCDALGRAPDLHFVPVGNAGNISSHWMGYS